MAHVGQCGCGAIRFELEGEPAAVSLCHCNDCRRAAGAPVMAWAEYPENALKITSGTPKTRKSSGAARRSFCPDCGTGLFYRNNDILPGLVEVQLATLGDADTLAPSMQIQTAERLHWMRGLEDIQAFERFP